MNYRVMKLLEFVNHFDLEIQVCKAKEELVNIDVCKEALKRLDELIGYLDEIEEITKRTYK